MSCLSEFENRLNAVENRLRLVENKLRKKVKEKELTLKERFTIHDRSQGLVRWFEAMVSDLPHENVWFCVTVNPESVPTDMRKASIKDMKEIVTNLSKLVDNALGVKFP